ncbi:MAG: hypothetical protein ABI273_05630 [Lacunisphaera sp.]
MSYALRRLLNHLPIQIGTRSDRRLRTTGLKHAQFASFLETAGFRHHHVDHYERSMRRRQWAKRLFVVGILILGAWIALESAKAITLF